MRTSFIILGSSLLALAACSGNTPVANTTADAGNTAGAVGDKAEDTAAATGMVAAPSANTTDAYVTNAAIGDMYEIESSKLALANSQSAAIKKFAQQMITDHTATTAKLKATLADAKIQVTPPAQPDARRQGMLDNLKGLKGTDFDKAYLDQQTAAHQEALTLHSDFAKDGDNEPLKKLAAATAPKVQHHFEMVKQLDDSGADDAH
jgi:putative membrane protein